VFPAGLPPRSGVRHVHRAWHFLRRWRCQNFFPGQRLAAITHFQSSVGGLVHLRFDPRAVAAAGRQKLQIAPVVAHHPIVAHPTFGLQAENGVQLCGARFCPVIVFRARRALREALVQRGKILRLQIGIGGLVGVDVLAPEFLHQPVLVHPVLAFHAPFGLWRAGADDADPQSRAHPCELGERGFPAQFLLRRGRHLIDVLPVGVQRQRHAIVFDPQAQHGDGVPGGLFLTQVRARGSRGVVHHIHHTA
jgi:hypothetical protein